MLWHVLGMNEWKGSASMQVVVTMDIGVSGIVTSKYSKYERCIANLIYILLVGLIVSFSAVCWVFP